MKGKHMKVHGIAKRTQKGLKDARASMPKNSSYRKYSFGSKKTDHPGMGGANIRGITKDP